MCELSAGFGALKCDSAAGIDEWYIGSMRDSSTGAANFTYTRSAGSITAMTNVDTKLFYKVLVDVEMSDFTVTSIGTRENASSGFDITGNIKLAGNTAESIEQFEKLCSDRVCVIAKLNDGTYEVLGIDKGVKFNFTRTSGTKFEDMNGVALTFTGREKKNAPKVSGTIVDALLV